MKKIIVGREFSNPWSAERLGHTKHCFHLGGRNDRTERLAINIAQSATGLSYQPRYRAKQAIKQMAETGKKYALIIRSRTDWKHEVYRVGRDGTVEMIATDVSDHRARKICNYYYGRRHLYPADSFSNYCHGGYTTRIGLDRLMKNEAVNKRCGEIALSHAIIDTSGKEGHDMRAAYRN